MRQYHSTAQIFFPSARLRERWRCIKRSCSATGIAMASPLLPLTLAICLTLAFFFERVTYAWVCLALYLLNQGPDRKSVWFVGSTVSSITSLCSGVMEWI